MGRRASRSVTCPQPLFPASHSLPESLTDVLVLGSCRFYRTATVTEFSPSKQDLPKSGCALHTFRGQRNSVERERSGQRGGLCSWGEGQRDSQRRTSVAWEFCPKDSLALWPLIKKCQLEVALVIAFCQRGQRPVCGQGAQGERLDVEKAVCDVLLS